jgi:hypothetical protein
VHYFTRTEGKSPEQVTSKDDFVVSAGLQVVPLVTVPDRVWAAAEARVIANVGGQYHGLCESGQEQLL